MNCNGKCIMPKQNKTKQKTRGIGLGGMEWDGMGWDGTGWDGMGGMKGWELESKKMAKHCVLSGTSTHSIRNFNGNLI